MNEIKISANGTTYRLTDTNNGNKYTRAKTEAGEDASIEKILAYYDKLGGNIQDKNHDKVENGKFWAFEKARLENERNDLENKTDEELETIMRRGENMDVSGSLFQLAKIELELRDRRQRNNTGSKNGIFFEVGGDMRNDGVIQTDKDAVVGVNVRGNYTSDKGKILHGVTKTDSLWEKYRDGIVIAVIATIIGGLFLTWILGN